MGSYEIGPWNVSLNAYIPAVNHTLTENAVIWTSFGFLAVFGIIVNFMMIVTLLRMKQTFFTTILIGLASSDLISASNSLFYVYREINLSDYAFHSTICYLPIIGDVATSFVTIQHVCLLSFIRFRSITRLNVGKSEMSLLMSRISVITFYAVAFVIVAYLSFTNIQVIALNDGFACYFTKPIGHSIIVLLAGNIILVTIILVICIALIILMVHRKMSAIAVSSNTDSKENQALVQLGAIVICFLVGYSADYSAKIHFALKKPSVSSKSSVAILLVTHGIVRVTECLNPFIYYLASSDIKIEMKRLICTVHKLRIRSCQSNNSSPPCSHVPV